MTGNREFRNSKEWISDVVLPDRETVVKGFFVDSEDIQQGDKIISDQWIDNKSGMMILLTVTKVNHATHIKASGTLGSVAIWTCKKLKELI